MASDWKTLQRKLSAAGCTMRLGGSGHYKVYKDGKLVSVLPHSGTNNPRALRNQISQLRRAGVDI